MIGAAIASSVSFASIEVFMTLKTWKKQNMHPFTSTYRRLTFIDIFMVVAMYAAGKALLLTGTNLEYTAFIIVYFVIIRYANVLEDAEMDMTRKISNSIRYNIDIHILQALKALAS
jgi:O-antigen/teichoic acid export membrane protein